MCGSIKLGTTITAEFCGRGNIHAALGTDLRESCSALNRICANNIDVPAGRLVYTQWLNDRGGIEADVTVTRISETSFLIVTIAVSQTRDFTWLKRHLPEDAHVFARDITSGLATLAVMGPKSRELLSRLSTDDFSTAAFPFGWSREVEVGYARVRASRVTFVGELGWELAIPTEFAAHVLEAILTVGTDLDLRHGGFFAINSMRMEKGYRHWGHDIGEEDTPLEAGLGFAVAFDKKDGFIGRDALLRQVRPPVRRLVQIVVPDAGDKLLHHEEPIWCGNRIVGSVTSGAYGHRVGATLGLGYIANENGVTPELLSKQKFEVEIAWERYPARVQLGPWYDPKSERVRA